MSEHFSALAKIQYLGIYACVFNGTIRPSLIWPLSLESRVGDQGSDEENRFSFPFASYYLIKYLYAYFMKRNGLKCRMVALSISHMY
nr:hypothetical transcript [Hymenolepis microstoma]